MTSCDPACLLLRLPGRQQAAIRDCMNAVDIAEAQLTLPLLRLLAAAAGVRDAGARRVLTALVEQELAQAAMADRRAPETVFH
jgi:hypothetical protein